ncbi:ExbD/TolR family protein [Burkholderia glumae]|uniref:Biopolymer transporter ExbD n=3 Tax=Burkholderia glumae TaxID=337 RepID=A0AAP9Y0E0_BURGL|nr:biopolymer transporter ExbD [Burkholderia glumae]ACR27741.1 Putative transport-related membrane protein [Burkholderia glumae BGR1]MCM2481279.1 biopolymer transporter ExbD [Burkholderia glumae]MCM2492040.1 biopolymer transporter ExbD [Burkholderia glumae]MCM2508581.1 biopolymer transporter ExbD [Burkholderia glumae]MCM2537049.1 biopolymer transporter ExbD [Burkholderia glumae]
MAFGGLDPREPAAPMAEINMTPLIDVMLVLLVIFIITAPLLTHAIRLDLPKAAAAPARERPDTITLSIDADGRLFWGAAPIGEAALAGRFRAAVARGGTPELHVRAAAAARYDTIARVMSAAQAAGLTRIGFVTEPDPGGAPPGPARAAPLAPGR